MSNYQLTYTQQIIISKQEYERIGNLIENGHRILIIEDVNKNMHLIDWHYVRHNDIEIIKPESLPGEK